MLTSVCENVYIVVLLCSMKYLMQYRPFSSTVSQRSNRVV